MPDCNAAHPDFGADMPCRLPAGHSGAHSTVTGPDDHWYSPGDEVTKPNSHTQPATKPVTNHLQDLLSALEETPHKPRSRPLGASVVMFKRTIDAEWERGIAILEDTATYDCKVIIDRLGQPVPSSPQIWTYHLLQSEGCFTTLV